MKYLSEQYNRILMVVAAIMLLAPQILFAAATYTFSPSSSSLTVNDTTSLTVFLQSGGDAVNAGDGIITFPTDKLQVSSITSGSLFSYWPETPAYSNVMGTITFAGGLPSPGFSGSNGQVLTINFTAIDVGSAQVCTTTGKILENDGVGTDIFSGLNCANYTINPAPLPLAPTVTSSTHPDQNETYNNNDPEFAWNAEAGVSGFSFLLDQSETTIPDDTVDDTGTNIAYTDVADGVWYFHIKAQNANGWGNATHFKISVDATAPVLPSGPSVTSGTHPDETAWYGNTDPGFLWGTDPSLLGFSYSLDSFSNTIPDDISEGLGTDIAYVDLADGVWYFHIKAQNENGWGDTTTFQVQIDSTIPIVSGSIEGAPETKDTTPNLIILATDESSGVAFVEVFVDGESIGTFTANDILNPITLSELDFGSHTVRIVATDLAGNTAQDTLTFSVRKSTVVERVTETITDIVPKPIKDVARNITEAVTENITQPVQELVEQLREIEEVVEITEDFVEPFSRAAAAVGVATAAATLPAGIVNAIFAFMRFGYLFITPFFARKRKKPWGTVIDSFTEKPIKGAVVRIFETEFNKMKESQITDDFGRFGFLVDPGTYTISVEKQGFVFPSKTTHADLSLINIYTGEDIVVDNEKNPNITVSIPIDPVTEHISERALLWKKIRDVFSVILERINWPLLAIGTGVSIWSAAIAPGVLNTLLLLLYILLIGLKFVQMKITFKSYGSVIDAETKAPVDLAAVRIFNADTSTMITTRITNQAGKFSALVRPGSYYLMVTKPPYAPQKTDPIKLSKSETLSTVVEMKKAGPVESATPPAPPPLTSTPPTPPSVEPPKPKESEPVDESPDEEKNPPTEVQPPTPPPLVDETKKMDTDS